MGQVGEQPSIALVHDFILTYGGAERVLSQFHQLYPTAPIYTLLADERVVKKHFPTARVIPSFLNKSPLRNHASLLLRRMPLAIESFDLSSYQLVLSSSGAFAHGVITGPQTQHICYCHSPMRYAWDWHSEYLVERGVKPAGLSRFVAENLIHSVRLWDAISAKRVDTWVANSKTVAKRIDTFYRADSTVIYPPVNTDFFNPRLVEDLVPTQPYFVNASRLTANKRVDLLIQVCVDLKLNLKIIGEGSDYKRLAQLAGTDTHIEFLGSLSEEDKRAWIVGAEAFLFGAEDDFGIAPVEALALGIPVIAYGKGGATEYVRHTENGLVFQEPTLESLREQLAAFVTSGVTFSSSHIRDTASRFNTTRFDEAITELIKGVSHG